MRRWYPRRPAPAVLLLLVLAAVPAGAAVLLSELCPDPATDWNGNGVVESRGDEWLEVVNTGPDAVDLGDYFVRDALGEDPQLRLSGSLAPGETALFLGSDAEQWQRDQGLPVSGLSLNNGGDEVYLYHGDPRQGGVLVDAVVYPAHVGYDDRSLARFLPEDEWVLCDGLAPYGGGLEPIGTGCPPTPGQPNACDGLVADDADTWTGIKRLYR